MNANSQYSVTDIHFPEKLGWSVKSVLSLKCGWSMMALLGSEKLQELYGLKLS